MNRLSYADWKFSDYLALAQGMLKLTRPSMRQDLECALRSLYGQPNDVLLCNSGRAAIRLALEEFTSSIRVSSKSEPLRNQVIVPSYICPSVVSTIQELGLVPVFVSIKADLNLCPEAVERATTPATLAILVVHMYGAPADIEAIQTLARERNIFLIDDAAQVAGVSLSGRPLGSFGDVGILSFAQSKTLVTGIRGSGGALIVSNPQLKSCLQKRHGRLNPCGNRLRDQVAFLIGYQFRWLGRHSMYYLERLGLTRRGEQPYLSKQMAESDLAVAFNQVRRVHEIIRERTRQIERTVRALKNCPGIYFPQYSANRYLARLIVALPPSLNVKVVREELTHAGIETRLGYSIENILSTDMSATTTFAKQLLEIPWNLGASPKAIDAMTNFFTAHASNLHPMA